MSQWSEKNYSQIEHGQDNKEDEAKHPYLVSWPFTGGHQPYVHIHYHVRESRLYD